MIHFNLYKINCCNGQVDPLDPFHLPIKDNSDVLIFIFYNLSHQNCHCNIQQKRQKKMHENI